MKLEGLKQLVKEELKRALSEERLQNQVPTKPGKYKIEYTTDNGSGADLEIVNITQSDIDNATYSGTNSLWFWKSLIDNNLFGRGDRVMNVEKIETSINEEESGNEITQDLAAALKQIAVQMQSQVKSVKPSPKDGELEELGGLGIASLIVGAPGLISFLGKAADGIADVIKKGTDSAVFDASTYKKGGSSNIPPSVGNGLRKAGHALEEFYLESLGGWLQRAFPKKYSGQDVKDKTSKLYDDAHKIYAGLLIAGATVAGFEVVHAAEAVIKGLEGGAAALKTKEIADIAQKIAAY
jgi:hypothetical protein